MVEVMSIPHTKLSRLAKFHLTDSVKNYLFLFFFKKKKPFTSQKRTQCISLGLRTNNYGKQLVQLRYLWEAPEKTVRKKHICFYSHPTAALRI